LRGHDTELGRDVAVKVLSEHLADDPSVLQRFVEEAQIGGQLQHPGVVPVYELGKMDGERPYFTMKLIKGRTLEELLRNRKGVDDGRRRFLSIFEAVCQTMAYAHSRGVIHRDLKPANVMVGAFGEVQVVDWGLAKVMGEGGQPPSKASRTENCTLIQTARSGSGTSDSDSIVGTALGTPAYMPPEQAIGDVERMNERSDVFALGGILLEVLTGVPTYRAGEGEHLVLLAARAELEPARLRLKQCAADGELKQLALECLEQEPSARPADAKLVASRIESFLSTLEEKAHRAEVAATEARELRRRQKLSVVLGVTILAAVITAGLAARSVERQRANFQLERVADAREDLDDATDEIALHEDAGQHDEAVATSRAALMAIEEQGVADEPLRARAQRLVEGTERRAEAYYREMDVIRKNEALIASCDELNARQIDTLVTFGAEHLAEDLDSAYSGAFQQYGINLDDGDMPAALNTLVESGIGVDVALALDSWAGLKRQLHGPQAPQVESIAALAFDLDTDLVRARLREALLSNEEQAVLSFMREESLEALEPATLWGLSQGLNSFGLSEECFEVIRDGAIQHPEDFLLNIRTGQLYGERGAHVAALGFLSAARGVRPDSPAVHALIGEYMRLMGYLPRAEGIYAEALRLNPNYKDVRISRAWLQVELGDYAGAVQSYDWLFERFPDETLHEYRGLLARFLLGDASQEDVIQRLASDPSLNGRPQAAAVWTLCFHPDPAQRDPRRVINIQNSWGHEEPATEATEAAALLQLGLPEQALAALDHGEELLGTGAVSVVIATSGKLRADYAVYRARAYLELGEEERAVQHLQAAEQIMRGFMYNGYEPWAATPLVRLYRETAELLGR
ncbi:MAG: tetratricopeptide (TPR) repeat protein, partial [Candidatus Paceibacteria bacterium]